jgi:ACS family tartrate transporter-like MFS transporter
LFRAFRVEAMAVVEHAGTINGRALYRRMTWRLIPYLFLLYIVAYLDRVNVGFAAMDMQRQLHFSNTVYGTGAGMFFLGYALFDLPSNLLLRRVGTRVWIARIMIAWGLIAACMGFVRTPGSFYTMRFLLGVGEAGFVPGMLLYLTFWFPSEQRARAVAWFMTATSLAGVVGGPLSGALLKLDGVGGLSGWQWLFLSEGVPTMLLGVSVLFVLRDEPAKAQWLAPEERVWLEGELARDRQRYGATEHHALMDALKLPVVWVLAGVYVAIQIGVYIVNLWMPLILNGLTRAERSADARLIARYQTVPYLLAAIFTVLVGASSDRWNERKGHLAGCMALAAVGWALATRRIEGAAAAGGIAMITMLGAFGGFFGPAITGWLRDRTHSFAAGLLAMGLLALGAALLAILGGGSNARVMAKGGPTGD